MTWSALHSIGICFPLSRLPIFFTKKRLHVNSINWMEHRGVYHFLTMNDTAKFEFQEWDPSPTDLVDLKNSRQSFRRTFDGAGRTEPVYWRFMIWPHSTIRSCKSLNGSTDSEDQSPWAQQALETLCQEHFQETRWQGQHRFLRSRVRYFIEIISFDS